MYLNLPLIRHLPKRNPLVGPAWPTSHRASLYVRLIPFVLRRVMSDLRHNGKLIHLRGDIHMTLSDLRARLENGPARLPDRFTEKP